MGHATAREELVGPQPVHGRPVAADASGEDRPPFGGIRFQRAQGKPPRATHQAKGASATLHTPHAVGANAPPHALHAAGHAELVLRVGPVAPHAGEGLPAEHLLLQGDPDRARGASVPPHPCPAPVLAVVEGTVRRCLEAPAGDRRRGEGAFQPPSRIHRGTGHEQAHQRRYGHRGHEAHRREVPAPPRKQRNQPAAQDGQGKREPDVAPPGAQAGPLRGHHRQQRVEGHGDQRPARELHLPRHRCSPPAWRTSSRQCPRRA